MKLNFNQAFDELSKVLSKYGGQTEIVRALLSGELILTGIEMTDAYRKGSCAMRSALNEWTKSSSEDLNKAFLDAVIIENLN